MTVTLLHAADIHLGYQQYNCPERYDDFAHAFYRLVDHAIARRADAVLLAGDLFHKRTVEPQTLLQASDALGRLRQAGIPAIAIEGNHERPRVLGEFSWLDYLAEIGLLTLLSPDYSRGPIALDLWTAETRQGAYLDLPGGVRVIGVKYYGASTPRVVRDLTEALPALPGPRPAFTVLMLHAGLQGVLDHYAATLTRGDLEALRPYADYLALGHIHKPFVQDDWIYNPGSLETNSVEETAWDDRGYLLVEIDPARQPRHRVTHVRGRRRLFVRLTFPVDAYPSPEALEMALCAYLDSEATEAVRRQRPVVDLVLRGVLAFRAADLDTTRLEALASERFAAIYCQLRDLTAPSDFEIRPSDALDREALERFVLQELMERDARRRPASDRWADLALRLKHLSLSGSAPEDVVEALSAFRREMGPAQVGSEDEAEGGEAAC
jgi:DNA repair exonuclease SbcCD nuclease subunit